MNIVKKGIVFRRSNLDFDVRESSLWFSMRTRTDRKRVKRTVLLVTIWKVRETRGIYIKEKAKIAKKQVEKRETVDALLLEKPKETPRET